MLATSLLVAGTEPVPAFPTAPVSAFTIDDPHANYGNVALTFEANHGQTDAQVKFIARSRLYTVWLTGTGMLVALKEPGSTDRYSVVSVSVLQAIPNVHVEGMDQQPGVVNYFVSKDARQWRRNVPLYRGVKYAGIYRGIDMIYYGRDGRVEYDFVVSPGGDPNFINLGFAGATARIGPGGELRFRTAAGDLQFERPVAYQDLNGRKQPVEAAFTLRGGQIGFKLGAYDRTRTLVIDPVLSFSTFLARSATEASGIAVDSSGNAHITGVTSTADFPTANALQTGLRGLTDAFVSKLDPSGTTLLYSTYFGGSGRDNANDIAIDSSGNAYITGNTDSSDFPTTPGAFKEFCGNFCNAPFAAKFLSNGELAYSTLLGPGNAVARAIAADNSGHAYIVGVIASNDLPVVNAFQPEFAGMLCSGCSNAFVQKLNPSGSGFVFSTYFGGGGPNAQTVANGVAVDSSGAVYVTGTAASEIALKDPLQLQGAAFLTKFTSAGNQLVYSTYLGGSAGDKANDVAVDGSGNAYVVGDFISCDFPFTLAAFSAECKNPSNRIFVLKMNSSGTGFSYSTDIAGGFAGRIALDAQSNAYITGSTADPAFPRVSPIQSKLQESFRTRTDAFAAKLNPSGFPVFSTFIGGAGTEDHGMDIAVSGSGEIYVTGNADPGNEPEDFPTIGGRLREMQCCTDSAFVAKIATGPAAAPAISLAPMHTPVVTLRNVSTAPLTINNIEVSPNFQLGGNCGTTVAPGGSCLLRLQSGAGGTNGTLTITSNATGSPHTFTIAKSQFGDPSGQFVHISSGFLQFAPQRVGTVSAPQTLTISNVGVVPATIGDILNFGDVQVSNSCPPTLPVGQSCTLSVTIQPGTAGPVGGSVAINHGFSRDDVFVSGIGSSSSLLASTDSIQFGKQFVGAPLARIVTLTNLDSTPISLTAPAVAGPFSQVNTCGPQLAAKQKCRVAVSFNPTGNGFKSGSVIVGHGGIGPPPVVSLFGTGLLKSDLKVSPLELDFHSIIIGRSFSQPVTLTNGASTPISITGFNLPPDYTQTNNCPVPIPPNSSCVVNVIFSPSVLGARAGNVTINHSGAGSPQVIPVTGTGTTALRLTPTQVNFGNQKVGTISSPQFLSVGNNGSSPVTINSISTTGDFVIVQNACQGVLQPFFGCGFEVVFTPKALGQASGSLVVVASDFPEPRVAALSGNGAGFGSATTTHLSFQPSFPVVGQTVSLVANVLGAGGTPTGTVTFKEGATVLNVAPLTAGRATFSSASFAAGPHEITAVYSADQEFVASNSTQTLTISKAGSSTTLTSTPNPSLTGQGVTLTASVSALAGGPATGTVDFLNDGVIIGSASIASGSATLTTTPSQGLHTMSAAYRGDAKHSASVSSGVPHLVNVSGLTSSSISLANAGAAKILNRGAVQLQVTVTSTGGTPSGTVVFRDGHRTLGSAVLDAAGRASFSTNQLTIGGHRLTAVYVGNATFAGSISGTITIQRSPRPR